MKWPGVIKYYQRFLPLKDDQYIVTLLEGNTPLIEAKRLRDHINPGLKLFLKYEGLNPTSSFKDRGMTMAVSKALEAGSQAVICASTGNTSASAAAYAARANLKVFVLIPEGKIALGKLSQAMLHGARVIQVDGNFDEALTLVREIAEQYPITLVNSLNPHRIEGQMTAAFEVCDHLGYVPTYHALPVGNAGNITAYWKGYKRYKEEGVIDVLPKMIGFQAEGAAPIVRKQVVEKPETVATAIRIGNPASWKRAEEARDESGGLIDMVSDNEILSAYSLIASLEGIFCEPASAASVAGVMKMNKKGLFLENDTIVCTLTGHGLKDPENAIRISEKPMTVPVKLNSVLKAMDLVPA